MNQFYKTCLLVLIPAFSFAQSNFKPGYVVSLSGDTLRGSINYKEWALNPKNVQFKNTGGKITTYLPEAINAFGVDKLEYYDSFNVALSMDDIQLSKLSTGLDTTTLKGPAFLKMVTKGKNLTLYQYNDITKNRYLIRDKNTMVPRELGYHQFIDSADSRQVLTRNTFRNQLLSYAFTYKSTPQITALIQRARYNDEIIEIVNLINGDDRSKTVGVSRLGYRFFAGVALNESVLKYSGSIPLATGPQSNPTYSPGIIIGVDFFQNASVGRLLFKWEIGFNPYQTLTASSDPKGINTASQKVDQQTFSLSPQVVYNIYNTNALKVYLGGGARINFSTYRNRVYTVLYSYNVYPDVLKDYPDMRASWFQFPLKAGVVINSKLEIYGSYNLPASVTDNYTQFAGSQTVISAGINYLFGIK